MMGVVNPLLRKGVDWPWFIASQFVFGVVAALTVMRADKPRPISSGLLAGCVGGLLMPIPGLSGASRADTGSGIPRTSWPAWCTPPWAGHRSRS